MANPEFIEENALNLAQVKDILAKALERDGELGFVGNRAKEYLDAFATLTPEQSQELHSQLEGLSLTRLKPEHMTKIVDFLPKTVEDLRVVLGQWPLSLPKKDQEAIVKTVKDFSASL